MTTSVLSNLQVDDVIRGRYSGNSQGELRLLEPLLEWLCQTRRVNYKTRVAYELPWFGRRVDVATLTRSRRTVAYELKLKGLRRALEQASYNRLAFDRSYVVTESVPRPENIALAAEHGIGLIIVRESAVTHLLDSPLHRPKSEIRARLLRQLRMAAFLDV